MKYLSLQTYLSKKACLIAFVKNSFTFIEETVSFIHLVCNSVMSSGSLHTKLRAPR